MAINQQSITEDRASGAVVLDSSLSFWNDGKGQYLTFTPSTNGNRKTWTISMWFQDIQPDLNTALIGDDGGSPNCYCYLMNNYVLRFAAADGSGGDAFTVDTTRLFRDVCGWYHLTLVVDTTESTDTDRIKVYINGESVDLTSTTYPDQYEVIGGWNSASSPMRIGQFSGGSYFEGQMSDVYSLDGYALGPENFGYTDALTNTWRPKKYEGAFNAPIDGWDVTTWSSYVSGSVDGSYPLSNCFTAPIGSGYANGTRSVNPGSLTFDISALNLTVTNVRLNVYIYGSPTLTVNGTAVPITGTDNQEFVVAVDGQLNSIVWSYNSVTVYCYMRGIEVDLGDGAGYRLFADASGAPAGVNGFHLPFDGSAPIGVDQSGNGNDFTPVNLTSSATIDKATSALPILNTSSGGNVAVPGVRGQAGIAVTVYNPTGSQNRYYFDGVEAPSYNFVRGQTVTFDLGDTTVATHQLKFSTTSDGTHGGGSAYDDGASYGAISAGTVGSATTITFPHNAENTLYYYCTAHSGMGGSVGLTTDVQKADTYAWKNVLAVAFDGGSSDYSDQINTGSTKKSITENTSSGETMEYRNFYLSSYKFDGTNDVVYAADSTEFTMGTGDWTIECWIRRRRVDTDEWFLVQGDGTGANTSFGLHIDPSTNYLEGRARSDSSGQIDFAGTTPMQTELWYHCALVRDSSTLRLFLNGNQENTNAIAGTLVDSTGPVCMGALTDSGSAATSCYMQDVRVYKGIAKYTVPFIPASTWNNICPDSPSGASYGSELTAPTEGAAWFDGSDSDTLTIANSSDFVLGTGDFTLECYIHQETQSAEATVFALKHTSGSGWVGYKLYVSTAGKFILYAEGDSAGGSWDIGLESGDNAIIRKRWHHIAATRNGEIFRIFVDGIQAATTTSAVDLNNSGDGFYIGENGAGSQYFDGFISNIRIVKGTSLYNQDFTPSNKPLTTTSQGATASEVKLLCCKSLSAATVASVTPSALKPSIQSYRDSTTASQDWDSSSASSSTSAALGPDDIYWIDLGQSTKVSKITFDVACSASANLTLTNFIIYYSTSSSSTGSSICYSGCTQTYNNTYTGSAPGTVSVTYEGIIPVSARYLGITNGSGSYSGTLTYSNFAVTTQPVAAAFNPFDTNIDMVMGTSGNYATLNPLYKKSSVTIFDGNLSMSINSTGHASAIATLAMTTGRYYWEVDSGTGWTNDPAWGIVGEGADHYDDQLNSIPGAFVRDNGRRYYEGTEGDIWMEVDAMAADEGSTLGLAYDGIAGTLQVWINGRYQGVAFTGLKDGMTRNLGSGTSNRWYPCLKMYDGGPIHVNFGQKPYKYPCPEGFGPLCSGNLERPHLVRPSNAIGVVKWTGDGNSPRKIEGFDFQPDLVVYKERSEARDWQWYDSVRGVGPAKNLCSNTTYDQASNDDTSYGYTSAFNHNGFSLTNGTSGGSGDIYTNKSGETYVSYCWKAGGNKNTFNVDDVGYASWAATGISGGTITPSGASIGTKEGFSVIQWAGTGATGTVPHGLGSTPTFIIMKGATETGEQWRVYQSTLGTSPSETLYLNLPNAAASNTERISAVSSTTFTLPTGGAGINDSGDTYIAYCWCNKPGLQRFGHYTGNGADDGPYVELGFKPAIVIVKTEDSSNSWRMWNSKIPGYNATKNYLSPDSSSAEGSINLNIDILSNGFKQRGTNDSANKDNETILYMAWAESPYHNLYGGQSRAM